MVTTKLKLHDKLPLTCTRTGTCCHGNLVKLNPWELLVLAKEKKITAREFRDLYTEFGGIRLKFNGNTDSNGRQSCNLYSENHGCSVHLSRPLACRLFPLGRQIQSNEVNYIYQGEEFPCSLGCPDVVNLPHLSVGEYLKGQETKLFEEAQDAYLDLMQNLADVAFVLLLDSGLAESKVDQTLKEWRKMGTESPESLVKRIGNEWLDQLMLPTITKNIENPILFAQTHNEILQERVQEKFETLKTNHEFHEAAVLIMGMALYLADAIGANPKNLSDYWIEIAKSHGAKE